MGKIPGFKQFSQMKKLANMDISALMGAGGGMPAACSAQAAAGMPNMPDAARAADRQPARAAEGLHAARQQGRRRRRSARATSQKSRDKRKAEKAARKKNRR